MASDQTFDVVIVGSGVGGGAAALRLARTGLSVAVLERGEYLPREAANWDPAAVFPGQRYVDKGESWSFNGSAPERPSAYYYVGGATKMFGGVMMRLRERDFGELEYADGRSPAWPIQYKDLEPYYGEAERLFNVHGKAELDPTEPPRVHGLPYPPVDHEPGMEQLIYKLRDQGLQPFALPLAIQRHSGGSCLRCATCDGFPCKVDAKSDAEIALIRPALAYPNVTLFTRTKVDRFDLGSDGKSIAAVRGSRDGEELTFRAKTFILAAGAINSAALLLRSAQGSFEQGLANSSGVVGRHYMAHNSSVIMALGTNRPGTVFQKTFGLNDFYFGDRDYPYPMGNVQMIGKVHGPMLQHRLPFLPSGIRQAIAEHSVDWYAQSEDLPHPDSRVTVGRGGDIALTRVPTNLGAHRELIKRTKRFMHAMGFPIVLVEGLGIKTTSHQCGTIRMGKNPGSAALDPFCRSFDHPNLFVTDGAFFPSSAGVNPSLTIAAQAMRAADHIIRTDFGVARPISSMAGAA
ncbi:MAG: glucose-methanol-choline oxidoreductase [Devosia sp.]|uniref:FAD-dependent oxidoreductase n=1 Tax=Devosia sp. TaxID=1871048 RepID=UPI00261A40A0|nr:GMC family oxidoreductase [Devosia sp.]MDB5527153.1 glucose-methanol-choline oxidoreductase [Devosia sp.]